MRGEEEWEIANFDALWPLTAGRQVLKTRYFVPLGDLTVEVDVYEGDLDGLVTAEVEFPDEASARAFDAPDVAGPRRHRGQALRQPRARGRRHAYLTCSVGRISISLIAHVPRARDHVGDRVRDVLGLEDLVAEARPS